MVAKITSLLKEYHPLERSNNLPLLLLNSKMLSSSFLTTSMAWHTCTNGRYYVQYASLEDFLNGSVNGEEIYSPLYKRSMIVGYNKVVNLVNYAHTLLADSCHSTQGVRFLSNNTHTSSTSNFFILFQLYQVYLNLEAKQLLLVRYLYIS